MYKTQSELENTLQTLGDNDVSTSANQLKQMYGAGGDVDTGGGHVFRAWGRRVYEKPLYLLSILL